MPFLYLFILVGGILFGLMTLLWVVSLRLRNASIIDISWGLCFVLLIWISYALTPQGYLPRKDLLCTLVTIWGLRLSLHIGIRNWGKAEDFRYAAWREAHGAKWWWLSFFQVFLLQAFLIWCISVPLLAAQTSGFPAILTPLDWLGTWVWIIGFIFEAIGDLHLMVFKANPDNRGKLLSTGLWKYTRHPNYFGEAVLWWGYYLIAMAAGASWTIFAPSLMTFLLIKVSGVAMLERSRKTKPSYEEYRQKTSAFLPWFPKK